MTLTLDVRTSDGGTAGTVDLDEALFGIEPNMAALHQAVTAQLAARRSGTHSTRTRAEVRGGGAKPWRQKGTGRARAGSIRAPQFAGGGVAHGPKPRDYRQKVNRKMVQLALRSALSDRARSERVMVIDEWRFAQPRTKEAIAVLENLSLDGQVLLVLDDSSAHKTADRSFRNLPSVRSVRTAELNAYDILRSDWLVFTRDTLPISSGPISSGPIGSEPTSSGSTSRGSQSGGADQ
ncbi:50S ribosomal protein L4 [Candidatus Poriferisodalis sp.]|uniref:50S ribosomal protein L4 n=1 Tax=Candidatus Poriferisodalis sp. TaxID=3101277 RepID=UPI003AF7BE74